MSDHSSDATLTFNQQIIDEFRANRGRVGGMFEGADLVLLTTVGAKSGVQRTSPVGYAPDGDRLLIFASNAGEPSHPSWFFNLQAIPHVQVEVGTSSGVDSFDAVAVPLEGEERERLYREQGERVPAYASYQEKTTRPIPVVALYRHENNSEGGPRADRSLSAELVRIHNELRAELRTVRTRVASGEGDVDLGPVAQAAEFRTRCLALCGGLHDHHINEDRAFGAIESQFPELSPALDRLRKEHVVVADLVTELRELLAAAGDLPAENFGARLDDLADQLEAHFAYEEEQLLPVLDRVTFPAR